MQAKSGERNWNKYRKRLRLGAVEPLAPERRFRHFGVMPVMDEAEELPATLAAAGRALAAFSEPAALLLVVNHPADAAAPCREHDLALLAELRAGARFGVPEGRLFWIDAASPGRELTQGVGEARRIGMDTALSLLDPAGFDDSLLFSLDADAWLRPDYFTRVTAAFRAHPEAGAAAIGFRHRRGKVAAEEAAIRTYEAYLARYVEALRAAGSPYAFQTVGSSLAARASAYAACGGMRVRPAGEDFYFMQALRKAAPVVEIAEVLVEPAPRPSWRVPFGTGKAVTELLRGGALPAFPEAGFAALKVLLRTASGERLADPERFRAALPESTAAWLDAAGFFRQWPKVLANVPPRPEARRKAFDDWFDGLKTRQFIRAAGGDQSP